MSTGTNSPERNRPATVAPSRRSRWRWRWFLMLVALLLLFFVVSDLFGWAYLRKPIAAFLSSTLDRQVEIDPPFSIHLRRSIPIEVGGIRIAAPDWSSQSHFADIRNIEADLDWGVIAGRQPHLYRLSVESADIHAERDAEGRASWSMGSAKEESDPEGSGPMLPTIDRLSIGQADIDVDDAVGRIDLQVRVQASHGEPVAEADAGAQTSTDAGATEGLEAVGEGRWRDEPVSFTVRTKGLQPVLEGGALQDLAIEGKLKGTSLSFNGSVSALAASADVSGSVTAAGPSLADLTVIPGLTLPDTPAYRLEGDLERSGPLVKVDVRRAEIGSSSMVADLEYDGSGTTPLLRGSLDASRLVLQDLGPSIGATGEGARGDKEGKGEKTGKSKDAAKSKDAGKGKDAPKGKDASPGSTVLPSREFDLPSLRAMNADVAVDLQKLDLGTDALRPLRSLKARLVLEGGVLKLQDLKSNVARGVVTGAISLDGSASDNIPVFDSKLTWDRVDLKNWVTVSDEVLVAGRFSGKTDLKGKGKSTAAILQSLGGAVKGHIDGGSISHQIVELAGLDAGQALGVFFSGDKPLELSCALVDLSAEKGRLRSNLFLLNTTDTIFFVQGGLNFRTEELDLRLVQSPKDWSPLSLRSPITIGGTLGDPEIGVEPLPLAMKVLSGIVLGAVTPIAALLPFIETEDNEASAGCAPAVEHVRKKAAELSKKPAPRGADEGAPRDAKGTLRHPGSIPGERP